MHLVFVTSLIPVVDPRSGYDIANRVIVDALRSMGHHVSVIGFLQPGADMADRDDTMLLGDILKVITQTRFSSFPVVNDKKEFIGIISLDDIRGVLLEGSLGSLVIARDVAVSGIEPIMLEENLNGALRKFISSNSDELPIVSQNEPTKVIGMLNRRDLIHAYNEAIREHLEKKQKSR